jgi:hypothetical protein
MKPKSVLYLLYGFAVFFFLVFFNYLRAQAAIKDTRTPLLQVELVSYPETVPVGGKSTFLWHVESTPDLSTSFTTIYWGYESSPSALTTLDSPEAVGYYGFSRDYTHGLFSLPGDFDLGIKFTRPGKVFFRAYAKVGEKHLWTEEKYLEVLK